MKKSKRKLFERIANIIVECDELAGYIAIIAVLSTPIWLPIMLLIKRKNIKKFGKLETNKDVLSKKYCIITSEDYIWAVAKEFKSIKDKAPSSYTIYDGYINIEEFIQTLKNSYAEDSQTTEFIKYHISSIIRARSKKVIDSMMEKLRSKEFNWANSELKGSTNE